jgi:hypothetical protein
MSSVARPLVRHLLAAALAAPALVAGSAGAATITVDTDLDADAADGFCSLHEAILAANADAAHNECPAGAGPDRIVFNLATPATITLTSELPTITETLLIRGPGPLELNLDGDESFRILHFDTADGGWFGVERLTLIRGQAPGGLGGDGGGAYVDVGETAFFHRVHFVANRSADGAGGLGVSSATGSLQTSATVLECVFDGNVAEGPFGGGGLALLGTDGEVRVIRSTFFDNEAAHENGTGGGILATPGGNVVILEASTVSGNLANSSGGGILLRVASPGVTGALIVRDSTITRNVADAEDEPAGEGGGIAFSMGVGSEATLELHNSVVADNEDFGNLIRPDLHCSGDVQLLASGFSFVGSNEGCATLFPAGSPNAAGDWVGTAAAPLDPVLDPLGDYGGPTPTHRPSPPVVPPFGELGPIVSPLIDSGSCPDAVEDQRGYGDAAAGLRRFDHPGMTNPPGGDGCDIGAVETGADPQVDRAIFADGFETGHTLLWSTEVL